ncbi:M23 family metallopeptidase [Candidatus Falkowbacteria bacterium]|nr:M23 family metallopeptidase [Candidatus Falkowbacteria bacterium]
MLHKLFITILVVLIFSVSFTANAAFIKLRRPLNITIGDVFSSYYDNDKTTGLKTYYCGTDLTYNGHKGTDFLAVKGTQIYAAAKGGLYYRYDNCPNQGSPTSTCGSGYGNHVKIDHENNTTDGIGEITIYAHMTKATVPWYQSLLCGAKIGKTGTSGKSTGPHLHFEIKKYGYPYDDPFSGSCSGSTSFWVNQSAGVPTTACAL